MRKKNPSDKLEEIIIKLIYISFILAPLGLLFVIYIITKLILYLIK